MKYEYNTFTSVIDITSEDLQASPEQTAKNVTLQMTKTLEEFHLQKLFYGDFEILSHSFLPFGRQVVISFLLRRELH